MRMNKSFVWRVMVLGLAASLVFTGNVLAAKKKKGKSKGSKVTEMDVVNGLERMVSHGRKIITANQELINDKEKGDKGFTPDVFAEKLTQMMKEEDKVDLGSLSGKNDAASKSMLHLLESMKKIINDAQPIINQKGMGFKGFLPAVFARRSLEDFNQKSNIKGKLTAKIYRNAKNAPDEWEKKQIEKFMRPDYKKDEPISAEITSDSGDKVLRYIRPEYYTGGCLKCHGEPKGEKDITGGVKEGFKDGDAGAALSFIVPLTK